MTEERDYSRLALVNGFDLSLKRAAETAAAQGIDRETIARLFVDHAHEVLTKTPGATPADHRGHAEFVLKQAMHLHSLYDDPKEAQ